MWYVGDRDVVCGDRCGTYGIDAVCVGIDVVYVGQMWYLCG